MKKSTKSILIIALSLICIGAVLMIIGLLTGASFQRITDGNLWNWVIHKEGIHYDSSHRDDNTYHIDPDGIRDLSIDWISGDIKIIEYGGKDILVKESSNDKITEKSSLVYRVKDGELYISCWHEKYTNLFNGLDESKANKDLVIKIPKELANDIKDLEIDAVSSELTVSGLTIKEFSIDTVSGNTTVRQSKINEIEINAVSGNSELFLLNCPKSFESDTTSGDVTLHLPHHSSFQFEFDSISGRSKVEGFDTISQDEDDNYCEYLVGKKPFSDFTADTISGDFTIIKKEK
ncbi:DUF4097 family beta strand repeat-containing protein [Ihubacter sp. mB4P-1]|uniref:DUF4097 family beta strand repeat-containing protein n=1 Tax=Ihubacter sp. mB4P-1 TaxID=3242370 RepID=UPI003C7E7D89